MTASQLPIDQPLGAQGLVAEAEEPVTGELEPEAEVPEEEKKKRRRRAFLLFFLLGLLVFLIGLIIWYLLFRQPIPLPLPIIPDSQLPAYQNSFYGMDQPMGIAVTPAGDRIYVTDAGGDRVTHIFDGGGIKLGEMVPPTETGGDHVPVWVAIDPMSEEVYVSDRASGAVYIYDRDGRYQRTFNPTEPITGWQPMGLAFDSAGLLYITSLSAPAPRVEVYDRTGGLVRTMGTDEAMAFPNGVAVDAAGLVYVTDSNNGRLLVFDESGATAGRIARGTGVGNLGLPRGIAVDQKGRVHIVDTTGQMVSVYRALADDQRRPDYIGSMGTQGIEDGQFQYPNGVALDARARVYVADTMNGRVQVWSY